MGILPEWEPWLPGLSLPLLSPVLNILSSRQTFLVWSSADRVADSLGLNDGLSCLVQQAHPLAASLRLGTIICLLPLRTWEGSVYVLSTFFSIIKVSLNPIQNHT